MRIVGAVILPSELGGVCAALADGEIFATPLEAVVHIRTGDT